MISTVIINKDLEVIDQLEIATVTPDSHPDFSTIGEVRDFIKIGSRNFWLVLIRQIPSTIYLPDIYFQVLELDEGNEIVGLSDKYYSKDAYLIEDSGKLQIINIGSYLLDDGVDPQFTISTISLGSTPPDPPVIKKLSKLNPIPQRFNVGVEGPTIDLEIVGINETIKPAMLFINNNYLDSTGYSFTNDKKLQKTVGNWNIGDKIDIYFHEISNSDLDTEVRFLHYTTTLENTAAIITPIIDEWVPASDITLVFVNGKYKVITKDVGIDGANIFNIFGAWVTGTKIDVLVVKPALESERPDYVAKNIQQISRRYTLNENKTNFLPNLPAWTDQDILLFFVNGSLQKNGVDYTISNSEFHITTGPWLKNSILDYVILRNYRVDPVDPDDPEDPTQEFEEDLDRIRDYIPEYINILNIDIEIIEKF